MPDENWLVENFEENRNRLQAVAFRMLGSKMEAEDAVQDVWIRLDQADAGSVNNFAGWLTTIVTRVCLDRLRFRQSRPEEPAVARVTDGPLDAADEPTPEDQVLMAESAGTALLVVLDLLTPTERVAFVLHDIFSVSFDEIGPIIGRSTDASRQLASRARRRLRKNPDTSQIDLRRQREVVEAFHAASRNGDFEALLALLDPDVIFQVDAAARRLTGAPNDKVGAHALATSFVGRAQGAQLALINGFAGLVWAPGSKPRGAFIFMVRHGKITQISFVADPRRVAEFDIVTLDA